jgi:hypothetical protein
MKMHRLCARRGEQANRERDKSEAQVSLPDSSGHQFFFSSPNRWLLGPTVLAFWRPVGGERIVNTDLLFGEVTLFIPSCVTFVTLVGLNDFS